MGGGLRMFVVRHEKRPIEDPTFHVSLTEDGLRDAADVVRSTLQSHGITKARIVLWRLFHSCTTRAVFLVLDFTQGFATEVLGSTRVFFSPHGGGERWKQTS